MRHITCTAGLCTAVAAPLIGLTAMPAAAQPLPDRPAVAAPAPVSQPTLRQGSRGAAVADLQRRLGGLAVDGIFGPATRRAVVAFQSSRGLAADGIVGPRTWGALSGEAVAPRASRGGQRSAPAPSAAAAANAGNGTAAHSSVGAAAVAEAARHAGKPYRYGATGPNSFDCSGFVQYVYRQVGVALPRTSRQQAAAARPVPRGSEQLGDLIIFRRGGVVSHVGIYAGDGTMWVARRSGTTVARQAIYTGSYTVGRVV